MANIKLKTKEAKRISVMLKNEIEKKEAEFSNTIKQDFRFKERREEVLERQKKDVEFLQLIKEKIDSEIFCLNV